MMSARSSQIPLSVSRWAIPLSPRVLCMTGNRLADWAKFFRDPSTACLSLRSLARDRKRGDARTGPSEYGGERRVIAQESERLI
jgi:hypothetical protein